MSSFANDFLRPLVASATKTTCRKAFPYLDVYCQAQSRLEYLNAQISRLRVAEDNSHFSHCQHDSSEYALRSSMINRHIRYVRFVLDRLDITNTIDHATSSNPDWCYKSLNPKDFSILRDEWVEYIDNWPRYVLDAYLGVPHKISYRDAVSDLLIKSTYESRRSEYLQRLTNACNVAHQKGWYFVFDTLTLAPERITDFYNNPNAIRDYCRSVGRSVSLAMGRKVRDSHSDIYQYFLVPEYGDKRGRLHFHVLHLLAELPVGTQDPAFGVGFFSNVHRTRREIETLKSRWMYGSSMPISVRYPCDAYTTKRNWLKPVDKKTMLPLPLKPLSAVINYIAKYASKNLDVKQRNKLSRSKSSWLNTIRHHKINQNKTFRIRMSRGFGLSLPSMSQLSMTCLQQLVSLHWSVSTVNRLIKRKASETLALRMRELTLAEFLQASPSQTNMLTLLRMQTRKTLTSSPLNSTEFAPPKLTSTDISNEAREWLESNNLFRVCKASPTSIIGGK